MKRVLWFSIIVSAVAYISTATALGKKPMDESTPTTTAANLSSIPIEVLYRDQQCNISQAKTQWIDSPHAYQTLFEILRKTYIGGKEQPPPVDFSVDKVLLVTMGQKNTGGYAVELANNEANVDSGVLTISVQWREPGRGMMVTQVLTSPCMLLKIPEVDFERIEINDQNGSIRLSSTR